MGIGTCLHLLCQNNLLICGQKRYLTDLFQIHAYRILDADAFGNGQIDVFHIQLILFLDHDILIINHQRFRLIHGIHAQYIDITLLQIIKNGFHLLLTQRKILEIVTDFLIFQYIFLFLSQLQKTFLFLLKLSDIKFHRFPSFHTLFLFYPYSKEICSFCFLALSSSRSFFSFKSFMNPSLSFGASSEVRFFRLSSFMRNITSISACCLSS